MDNAGNKEHRRWDLHCVVAALFEVFFENAEYGVDEVVWEYELCGELLGVEESVVAGEVEMAVCFEGEGTMGWWVLKVRSKLLSDVRIK